MIRVFVERDRFAADQITLSEEDHRYLTRVLRLEVGDLITIFDGQDGEADARIMRIGPRAVELRVEERRQIGAANRPALTLIQALAKGEKLDLVVQKATELGATRIMPVTSARSIPQLEAMRAIGRRTRWQKIAREAARQCGRPDVPTIEAVTPLPTALHAISKDAFRLILWEGARSTTRLSEVLPPRGAERPHEVAVAVGPEGGFSPAEVETAKVAGFVPGGLGPRVLRTETAALAILSILQFRLGDLS
jgi:16S rRNA (uracil1498-N3)-methyltransferase